MSSNAKVDGTRVQGATVRSFGWMWLARHLDWLRPGLRAAVDADATRLRELPKVVGIVLPIAAIAVPLAFSVGTATSPTSVQGNPYDQFAFLIYDVFTESTPFMLTGLAIGLATPAAGVLFVLSYVIGNFGATIVTGELQPPVAAAFGRLATYALLWLLVVEIPLLARVTVESFGGRADASTSRRLIAVVGGAAVTVALIQVWVLIAPISATAVYYLTSLWGAPFLRGVWTLLYYGHLVVLPAAAIALVLLGFRYLGQRSVSHAEFAEPTPREAGGIRRWLPYVSGLGLTALLLLGVLHKPLDAVILFAAIVLGPTAARIVLRATRVAPLLVRIAWPVRLIIGVALSYGVSLAFLTVVGNSDVSRWFHTLLALAMSFFVIELLLEADAVVGSESAAGKPLEAPVAGVAATLAATLTIASYLLPAMVLAHDGAGEADSTTLAAAGGAAGGAGAAAAAGAASRRKPPPNPPKPTPKFRRHFNTRRDFDEWAEETNYDGPPPDYLTPGGPPPVNLPPTPPGF